MTDHKTGTREEWLAARLELLEAEKALTRRSDELARRRQELPWVRIDKDYVFDTDEGVQTLCDLFAGRSQLLVYHFMFGPTWSAGCATCTLHAESFDRAIVHLEQRDVTMVCVSRAPLARLKAYKERLGLTVRWVSSLRSDFNYDFSVSLRPGDDPDKVPSNFGTTWFYNRDEHEGLSAFALKDGVVYHTYSCHLRGVEEFNVTYQLLDRVPCGRDEDKLPYHHAWIRRRDEYGAGSCSHCSPQASRKGRYYRRRSTMNAPDTNVGVEAANDICRSPHSAGTKKMFEASRGSATMIATRRETAGGSAGSGSGAALRAADWLCLAAAPTFAIMALLTGVLGGPPDMLCSAAHDASPLSGMVPMYSLMSAFHSAPWLKLISGRRGGTRRSSPGLRCLGAWLPFGFS